MKSLRSRWLPLSLAAMLVRLAPLAADDAPAKALRYQILRDVLYPKLLVAEKTTGGPLKGWRTEQSLRKSPESSVAMKFSLSNDDVAQLARLKQSDGSVIQTMCVGTRVLGAAGAIAPNDGWRTTELHLTLSGDQVVNIPVHTGSAGSRYVVEVVLSVDDSPCPNNGDSPLQRRESLMSAISVANEDSGWKLTFADATLLLGRTRLPDLADGTDRRSQSFRVGGNAFPWAETRTPKGLSGVLGYLGLGANVSLLDFNQTGNGKEPGVGVVVAPAFLHRTLFGGVGWNLVQPSRAQFDPTKPNSLIHLRERRYWFVGVSGIGLKNWLADKQRDSTVPPTQPSPAPTASPTPTPTPSPAAPARP